MNEYELMTVLNPRLNAEETAALIQSMEGQISSHGGEVLSTDVWGRRRLAYPIGTHMEGHYVLFTLRMPPEGAASLEAWFHLTENVLRHLLIRGIIPYQGGHDRDRERDFDRDADREDRRDDRDGDEDRERERDERQAVPVGFGVAEAAADLRLAPAGDDEGLPGQSDEPVATLDQSADAAKE